MCTINTHNKKKGGGGKGGGGRGGGTKLMSESYCLSHRVFTHPGANLGTGPDISMKHGNGGNEESPFPASSTSDRS